MSTRSRSGGDNFLAMTVHNIGFLLDRLGQDCHPLQYLRELTQNSIEAILRTGQPGEITKRIRARYQELTRSEGDDIFA